MTVANVASWRETVSRNPKLKALESRKHARRRKSRPLPARRQPALVVTDHPEKMSEVLEDFVEPYLGLAHDYDSCNRLYGIAAIAWNMALFPPDTRQKRLDEACKGIDGQDFEDVKTLIAELVQRKERYFSDNRRAVVSFDLADQGDSYYLSVMSTLDASR
jgi:hypothetical protein